MSLFKVNIEELTPVYADLWQRHVTFYFRTNYIQIIHLPQGFYVYDTGNFETLLYRYGDPELVEEMNPDYIVFSNSESDDLKYGAANNYNEVLDDPIILKTSDHGTIVLCVDFNNNYHFEDSSGTRI